MTARWPLLVLVVGAVSSRAYGFQIRDQAALTAERDAAVEQVKRIVNVPVPARPLAYEGRVGSFNPVWFHEGAMRPDFLTVDVRITQLFPYDKYDFVTSDLTPGVMFRGQDLEFNAMTKYFYTDRTVPKKRLTPEEMVEINRLYRIIGEREQDLARLRGEAPPAPAAAIVEAPAIDRKLAASYVAGGLLLATLAVFGYRMFASRS